MEEIKVGEYVRTPEQGFIGKLVEVNKNVLNYYKIDVGREIHRINGMSDNYIYSRDGFGLKHSSNIIDLIEVDDYVNGKKVIGKFYEESLKVLILDTRLNAKCRSKDIKTIVTKEKFESESYRLEE